MILIGKEWFKEIYIKPLRLSVIKDKYITSSCKCEQDLLPLLYNDFIKLCHNKEYVEFNSQVDSIFVIRTENVRAVNTNSSTTVVTYVSSTTTSGTVIPFEHYMLFQHCPWDQDLWYYYELQKEV